MNDTDDQRSPALDRAAEGTDGWEQAARLQRHAAPDHADFYALAGEIVTTLHALEDLTEILSGQVAGYAQGRPVYDDTRTVDPAARLAESHGPAPRHPHGTPRGIPGREPVLVGHRAHRNGDHVMSRSMHVDRRNRRVPVDRCEVCCAVLGRRPQPHRRRCAEHLAQLALVPLRDVGRRTRRAVA